MEYIDFNIVQTGKTLSSDKIIINKYDNKISRLFFNFDGTILGRLYFAMLNPITNKYCMKPILNSQVIITTEVSVYPGKWSALLVGVQDDYEIIDNNIDQSKVTFVSNPFNRIIVRDNFLSDSSIEPTVNPAIDETLESLRISQDRLENAAIKATESALLSSENAEKTAQDKAKIEEMVKSVEGIDAQVKLVETYKNDASSSAQQASTALSSVNKQSEQVANMKQSIDSTYGQVTNLATKVSEDANTVSGIKSSIETLKNETQNLCKLAEDAKAVAELASTQTSKDKTTIGEWKISIDEIKNQIVIDKAEMDKIKADVNTNKVSSENAAKQTTEDKNAVHLDRIAVETVKQNVEKLGQAVQEATQSGVQMVNQSKQTAVSEITKTGNTHKTAVEAAGTTAVQNIGTSKTDALEALETAKTDCTSAINSEGKKQTQAITTEGQKHLTTIQQTAQQATADVNNAGQLQTERVQSAGNTAVESVKTAKTAATKAVETAQTEAVKAVQTEGTTQTGNVTAEGTKQVQAVQAAAQEIMADREQIAQNKADVTALKEDLSNERQLSLIHNQFDNVGLKNLYTAGDIESEYTGGTWKWISKRVELPVGTYTLVVKDMKRNDKYPLYIEAIENGTNFGQLPSAGYVVFNVTDAEDYDGTVQLRIQISDAEDNEAGTYFARGISIYAGDVSNKLLTTTEIATEIATEKLSKVKGKNLFDKNSADIVDGYFIDYAGKPTANEYSSVYYATWYIPIKPNTTYALTDYVLGGAGIAIFDKSFNVLSYLNGNDKLVAAAGIFTTPEKAAFVRLSGNISEKDRNQLEEGNAITSYEDYTEFLPLTNLEKEVKTVKENLDGLSVNGYTSKGITGSATNLTNGESITLESPNIKYDKHLSFFSHITNFSSLEIGRTATVWGASYAVIDATNITVYRHTNTDTQVAQVAHGLTFADYIGVTIDVGAGVATINIKTNGGAYSASNIDWDGAGGNIYVKSVGSELSNCTLSWFADCWKYDIWAFGDSYFDFYPVQMFQEGHDKFMVDMYSGRGAPAALTSFKVNLAHGMPKYALWCMGMNNVDSDTSINNTWLTATEEFISICEQHYIIPILCTIPNVRGGYVEDTGIYNTHINTFKNAWVRNSGNRYIDLSLAVGADDNYDWYDGMLGTDGVHPTRYGTQAIMAKIYADFPEILECS